MTVPEEDPDRELNEAIAEFLRRIEAGGPVDRTAFLRAHPGIAPQLEKFLANYEHVGRKMQPFADRSDAFPRRFGPYELLEEIGRGGMGVVYKANDLRLKKTVALKMILWGKLATPSEVERFRFEAEAAAALDHPNIVPIYELGEIEGQHYFTMKFIDGRSLEKRLDGFRSDPRAAAQLLLTLSRAVRYALQQGLLHRDLKPANVLIDSSGTPYLTDFGLAKRVDGNQNLTASGELLGTVAYMAPEQAAGKRVSTAVDVYGLGAILYALLTGRAPFQGANAAETLVQVRDQDPADPRASNPAVPAELGAICLKCLEKSPARRYESPRSLAEELEKWLEGRPIQARPVGRSVRLWRWCRRNAAKAIFIAMAAALVLTAGGAVLLQAAQRHGRRQEILESNAYVARHVASVVLNRFQKWGADVERAASHPEIAGRIEAWNRVVQENSGTPSAHLLDRPEAQWLQRFCEDLHQRRDPALENWHILDAQGTMVARTPDGSVRGSNFQERDYFKGTMKHASTASRIHVSSVFRSVADNLYKFDICVPLVIESRTVGVIAASVTTDSTMGLPNMHDERRKAVLVAPWDHERRPNDPVSSGPAPEYLILLHPAYARGQNAVPFGPSLLTHPQRRRCDAELSNPFPDGPPDRSAGYEDPFGALNSEYRGRWLAAFAPVGNTGFVVLIQQRAD